jgi:peptide/nickel transport system permease protein
MESSRSSAEVAQARSTDPTLSAVPPLRPARSKVVRPLLKLIARSLLRIVVMLWAVATVTFLAIRALPGNPVDVWVQDLQNRGLTGPQAEVMATRLLKIDVTRRCGASTSTTCATCSTATSATRSSCRRARP